MHGDMAATSAVTTSHPSTNPVDREREALRRDLEDPKRGSQSWLTLVFLVVISLLWLGAGFDAWSASALLGAILFHELGHLVAMRAFGYTDTSIYIVPFMGGVAMGRPTRPSAWAEGIVLLAGPLPGMLLALGVTIAWGVRMAPMPDHVSTALGLLFIVNAFNLLPAGGLDGGRLVRLTLLAGKPLLETVFGVATSVALGLLFWSSGDYLLVGLAVLWVIGAISTLEPFRQATALRSRFGVLPVDPRQLTDDQFEGLYDATVSARADILARSKPKQRQATINSTARLIHSRASVAEASIGVRLGLLAIYGVAILLVVGVVLVVLADLPPV